MAAVGSMSVSRAGNLSPLTQPHGAKGNQNRWHSSQNADWTVNRAKGMPLAGGHSRKAAAVTAARKPGTACGRQAESWRRQSRRRKSVHRPVGHSRSGGAKAQVAAAIAPGPGITPGGHLPRMIMPRTSSLVTSRTRAVPTTRPFFMAQMRSAKSKTS